MNTSRRLLAATGALILAAVVVSVGQQTETPGVHPISGRRYAVTMSYLGADWLDREERDVEEEPDVAIAALDLKRGMVVADIGAGSGYMTVRLAKKVGPTGKVYGEDIQPEMIALLQKRVAKEKIPNIIPLLGLTDDPKLPADSLDLELLVDVYHEFNEPQKMLRALRASLKSDGRLVLLEYKKEDPTIPIRPEHKMTVAEAKLEVEAEGFTLAKVDRRLPRQHILIFTKKP